MKKELREQLEEILSDLESISAYQNKKIEACLDSLASAIWRGFGKKGSQPKDLSDSIRILPFSAKTKRLLAEVYSDIQSAIEGADYDSGDYEQVVDMLSNLISDFHTAFTSALEECEAGE